MICYGFLCLSVCVENVMKQDDVANKHEPYEATNFYYACFRLNVFDTLYCNVTSNLNVFQQISKVFNKTFTDL